MSFTLPELSYSYDALEPFIDAQTMEIHYTKHHQAYVDNLNKALEGHTDLLAMEATDLLQQIERVPQEIRQTVINNGGGHANHSFFWPLLKKNEGKEPQGAVRAAIDQAFGDFATFKAEFAKAALARFGSGWVWLSLDENGKNLHIGSTANQDSPYLERYRPLLGLDVWEHAYYLKYQNRRAEYVENWWNVVNWEQVEKNFSV